MCCEIVDQFHRALIPHNGEHYQPQFGARVNPAVSGKLPTMGNRLKELRTAKGWTHERAADEMHVSRSHFIKLERGERRLTDFYIRKAVEVFGVDVSQVISIGAVSMTVPIVGRAGAGPFGDVVFDSEENVLDEVPAPPGATEQTVGLDVQGDSMRGIANDGWLIFYDDRRDPPSSDMLGELCVVGTGRGQVLVKFLQPGRSRGLFDLESVNAPTLRDEPVVWAALVTSIVPRKPARRFIRDNTDVGVNTIKTD